MAREFPHIFVVIPNFRRDVTELVSRLEHQTLPPRAIEVVKGVSPNGAARNIGVERLRQRFSEASNPVIVFIDDDALPGPNHLLEALVTPLLDSMSRTGITGAARILPENSSWFQRRVAREIPRTVNPIPDKPIESNPPLEGYGHSLITTTCCALRYSTYKKVGGFSNHLTSGVDTDFFYRVRKHAYRFLMVPGVHVEHPAPKDLPSMIKKFYWYGLGYAQEVMRRPEQRMGPQLPTILHRSLFLFLATLWVVPNIFILWSYGYPKLAFGFRPLKALSTFAVALGYVNRWASNSV